MSQQDFDSYLALLCRLLRIAPQQREQVAEEFRTHMEDRLEELLAAGLPREEAIQQAIGEFGDAAGLAAQLLKIQQGRRKRWIMRISAASVLCVALGGLLCLALLPGHQQVPLIAKAQAQDGAGEITSPAAETPEERIEKALSKPIDLTIKEQPLKDVIVLIQEMAQVPVFLEVKKLEEAAINTETPVSFDVKGISLKSGLRLMLGQLGLTYVVEDEVVQITTPEDAGSRFELRIYDCRTLLDLPNRKGAAVTEAKVAAKPAESLPAASAAPPPQRFGGMVRTHDLSNNLVGVITETVSPDSWCEVGGPGAAREYKGMIIVTQTRKVHEEIEKLLNLMHKAADLEGKVKVSR